MTEHSTPLDSDTESEQSLISKMKNLKTSAMEQGVNPPTQRTIGEDLIAHLEVKYASMVCGQHIFVKELEVNLIGSVSVPDYIGAHQDKAPAVRTEYFELETLGLTSYSSIHTVIKVGKQVPPIVAPIIPGKNGPLILGNN